MRWSDAYNRAYQQACREAYAEGIKIGGQESLRIAEDV